MNVDTVVAIIRQAIELSMISAGPLLLAALVMGLVVSVFQAATQINEMTLSFLPKLFVMFVVLVMLGPWTLQLLVDYVVRLITSIPNLIG